MPYFVLPILQFTGNNRNTRWFSLALARSVGILAISPLHCFIIVF